ncbi:MAG: hypothetical protein WBV82_09950 [Myxococcaceae bacterium]
MIDLKDLRKQLAHLEKDDILKLFNVEERRTAVDYIVPAVGVFSVGVLVGAGLGLLLAPKPGRELREELRSRLQVGEPPVDRDLAA